MRTTSLTPGSARRLRVSNCSTSPTRPTIVRCTPRLTNADPPAPCTVRTTASSSSAVASGDITTTMAAVFHSDLEAFDGGVRSATRTELDEIHRCEHEQRSADHSGRQLVAADGDTEDAGEDRLHGHHDRGPGRVQVRLRPRLHEERERRRCE